MLTNEARELRVRLILEVLEQRLLADFEDYDQAESMRQNTAALFLLAQRVRGLPAELIYSITNAEVDAASQAVKEGLLLQPYLPF